MPDPTLPTATYNPATGMNVINYTPTSSPNYGQLNPNLVSTQDQTFKSMGGAPTGPYRDQASLQLDPTGKTLAKPTSTNPSYDPNGYNDPNSPEGIKASYQDDIDRSNKSIDALYVREYQQNEQYRKEQLARSHAVAFNRGTAGYGSNTEMTGATGVQNDFESRQQNTSARMAQDKQNATDRIEAKQQLKFDNDIKLKNLDISTKNAAREEAAGNYQMARQIKMDSKSDAGGIINNYAAAGNYDDLKKDQKVWSSLLSAYGDETSVRGAFNVAQIKADQNLQWTEIARPDENGMTILHRYAPDGKGGVKTQDIKYNIPYDTYQVSTAKPDKDGHIWGLSADGKTKTRLDPVTTSEQLDNDLKQAQIDQAHAAATKSYADAKKAGQDAGGQTYHPIDVSKISDENIGLPDFGGLSYNGLLNAAKNYLANKGKMPSLGLGQATDVKKARLAVVNYAGQIADNLGLDMNQISLLYQGNSKAASSIITRVAKIEATAGALSSQFPRLAEIAGQVGNMGITESDLTKGKAEITRKFGNVNAANYIELIQTVRGDYAAMQASLAGSQGGQYFAQNAADAIPLGLTPEQYQGIQQTIEQSSRNALSTTQDEVNRLVNNSGGNYGYGAGNTGNNSEDASNQENVDHSIQQHMNDYTTREALIQALVSSGVPQKLASDRVYALIPDKK